MGVLPDLKLLSAFTTQRTQLSELRTGTGARQLFDLILVVSWHEQARKHPQRVWCTVFGCLTAAPLVSLYCQAQ